MQLTNLVHLRYLSIEIKGFHIDTSRWNLPPSFKQQVQEVPREIPTYLAQVVRAI